MTRPRRRPGAAAAVVCAVLLSAACRRAAPVTVPREPAAAAPAGDTRPSRLALGRTLDALLDTPALRMGTIGVVVRSLRSDDVLYERNPHTLLSPASTLKVITLAAAADRLGWDFTYETQVLGIGAIDFGFLDGDLVVRGSGDPSIGDEEDAARRLFRSWADRLKALGVRSLSGRIIGDDNAFDDEAYGAGWMWDDMDQAFSAGVGALQVNTSAAVVVVAPGPTAGTAAGASLSDDGTGLTLRSDVTTTEAGRAPAVSVRRAAHGPVLHVTGSVPAGGPAVRRRVAVVNPTRYFVERLRQALVENGIEVKGPAVDIDDLSEPPRLQDAVTLVTHRSPPLRALAATMMRVSQNQYAETLLKTIGARGTPGVPGAPDAPGAPGGPGRTGAASEGATFDDGRRAVLAALGTWGIAPAETTIADGSGLSRYNLVTADALVRTLVHVARDTRLGEPFMASLPTAASRADTPTTLTGRVTASGPEIRAKTGSMRNVRAMAGYTQTGDAEPVAFAVLANNYGGPAEEVDRAIDGVLQAVGAFTRSGRPADR